jgi:uncharacterized protein
VSGGNSGPTGAARSAHRCPICGKPASPRLRPFCSARCQTIDLARWIGGNYRVPTEENDQSEEREDRDDRDE